MIFGMVCSFSERVHINNTKVSAFRQEDAAVFPVFAKEISCCHANLQTNAFKSELGVQGTLRGIRDAFTVMRKVAAANDSDTVHFHCSEYGVAVFESSGHSSPSLGGKNWFKGYGADEEANKEISFLIYKQGIKKQKIFSMYFN